jgi:hypothetical protein
MNRQTVRSDVIEYSLILSAIATREESTGRLIPPVIAGHTFVRHRAPLCPKPLLTTCDIGLCSDRAESGVSVAQQALLQPERLSCTVNQVQRVSGCPQICH